MKRLLILAAAVLALSLSAAAQTQDQTAKALSDMARLVGSWTSSMENPMGGDNIEGVMSFVQDDKGIHFEIDGGDMGYFVSDPLKVDESGRIICLLRIPPSEGLSEDTDTSPVSPDLSLFFFPLSNLSRGLFIYCSPESFTTSHPV